MRDFRHAALLGVWAAKELRGVANGLRALAANDFVPEDEPLPDKHHTSIDPKELFKLVRKFFDGYKEADMMAVLKRCILFIFGKRATYLRLPSQDRNALIHCIRVDDLHEDLFTPRDEDFYAKYKVGIHEPPPTFEADVAKEQELLLQGIESMQTAGRPETPTHIVGGVASSSSMNPPTKACDDDPDEQAARDMHK